MAIIIDLLPRSRDQCPQCGSRKPEEAEGGGRRWYVYSFFHNMLELILISLGCMAWFENTERVRELPHSSPNDRKRKREDHDDTDSEAEIKAKRLRSYSRKVQGFRNIRCRLVLERAAKGLHDAAVKLLLEGGNDMTKFGGDDSAGYIKVLSELRRFIDSAIIRDGTATDGQQSEQGCTDGEDKATSVQGVINFNGRITGRNVIAGPQTMKGGTTNLTFN